MDYHKEIFELPCGYLNEDGFLYTHVEVREMTGHEEDILTNRKKLRNGIAINDLIASCCRLTISPDKADEAEEKKTKAGGFLNVTSHISRNMTQGDRLTALLRIRQISYGNSYKFEYSCSECSKRNAFIVDLTSLDLKKMESPHIRTYDFQLPRSKDTLTFKISTGMEEQKMQKMVEQSPGSEATINLASRLLSVNGDTVSPISYLKTLSVRDRQAYRDEVEKREGGIETSLEVECLGCGVESVMEMPIQESFFLATSD